MELCTKCQKNPRRSGQRWCLECFRSYQREWQRKNRDLVRARNKAQYQKDRAARLEYAAAYRAGNAEAIHGKGLHLKEQKREIVRRVKDVPCADCGRRWASEAMDFDHVRGVKKYSIAQMAGGPHSIKAMLEEIAKCEVVCACCHRIRTAQRRVA